MIATKPQTTRPGTRTQCSAPGLVLGAAVALVFATAVRLLYVPEGGHFDEYYHVLAAQGLLEGQGMRVGDSGWYDRSAEFTYLVAASMAAFGESIWAGRLPSVLAGGGGVALLWFWLRRESGSIAAWSAAAITSLMPMAIALSCFARFYMLQTLLVLVAAFAVYRATDRPFRCRSYVGWLAVAGVAMAMAVRLQATSAFALAAMSLWVVMSWVVQPSCWATPADRRRTVVWLIAMLGALGVFAAGLVWFGGFWWHVTNFRSAAPWAQANQDDVGYYHRMLLGSYGVLWFGLPLIAAGALVRHARLALFALLILGFGLAIQSLAGMKAPRYVLYLMPFLVVLWSLAAAELLPRLARLGESAWAATTGRGAAGAERRFIGVAFAAACVALLLHNTPAVHTTRAMLDGDPATHHRYTQPDWEKLVATLRPILTPDTAVVTPSGVKAMYHLRRLDISVSVNQVSDISEGGIDPRTGRPVISTPASLAGVTERYPTGLIIVEDTDWRNPSSVSESTADWIEAQLIPVALPAHSRFVVYRWD